MKKLSCVLAFASLLMMGGPETSYAQEVASGFNPNSVRPIHDSDILYKKRVWRRMDLKEKQNRPFFAYNNEITKIIIEAVKQGILHPYANDSLKTRMSKEKFLENLQLPIAGYQSDEPAATEGDEWGSGASGWGDEPAKDAKAAGANGAPASDGSFFNNQVSVLEIMEDMIFDKKRSRLYFDIQSVKLVLPPDLFPETGLLREVGVFRYKDLVELFKSMPQEAIWYNPQNQAAHRSLADAFELRLFNARIVKIGNPRDEFLVDIYNQSPKDGIMASMRMEQELMEMEHNLWEF
ncbi:MAG: gliding motility protein GldN [Bacteroidota bacterium]|nr:gliding motility protein GldN [Bacteroidota bacterium]